MTSLGLLCMGLSLNQLYYSPNSLTMANTDERLAYRHFVIIVQQLLRNLQSSALLFPHGNDRIQVLNGINVRYIL